MTNTKRKVLYIRTYIQNIGTLIQMLMLNLFPTVHYFTEILFLPFPSTQTFPHHSHHQRKENLSQTYIVRYGDEDSGQPTTNSYLKE